MKIFKNSKDGANAVNGAQIEVSEGVALDRIDHKYSQGEKINVPTVDICRLVIMDENGTVMELPQFSTYEVKGGEKIFVVNSNILSLLQKEFAGRIKGVKDNIGEEIDLFFHVIVEFEFEHEGFKKFVQKFHDNVPLKVFDQVDSLEDKLRSIVVDEIKGFIANEILDGRIQLPINLSDIEEIKKKFNACEDGNYNNRRGINKELKRQEFGITLVNVELKSLKEC